MLMIRAHLGTCWSSENVSRVQEILGDNTHGAMELADPPAVNVILLETKIQKRSNGENGGGQERNQI